MRVSPGVGNGPDSGNDNAMRNAATLLALLMIFSSASLRAAGGARGQHLTVSPTPSGEVLNEPLSPASLKMPASRIFLRVVQARLFHNGDWTLSGSSRTPLTIGRTLAALHPTFVTGLLRAPDRGGLSEREVEGYSAIRSAVLGSNKGCRFDVVVNAGVEQSAEQFVRRLRELGVRLHPDAWTFYVAPEDVSINPGVFAEGTAAAHAQGMMVGYDGPLSLIPQGIDYLVVRAWDLHVNRRQLDQLRESHRIPILVELPTSFGNRNYPEVSRYLEEMDSSGRSSVLSGLAENQGAWGYRFAYPVFYPIGEDRRAFDATGDNILMVTIRALLARFN